MRSKWLPRLAAWGLLAVLGLAERPALAEETSPSASGAVQPGDVGVQKELDRLARWVRAHKGQLSALVVEMPSGRVVASHDESKALNPASNAKVLTAAVALSLLGPDYRFTSSMCGQLRDGVVPLLVLRSNGDPSLSARDLDAMVKQLVASGVKRVGNVAVDQSYFDEKFVPPAFEQQPNEWAAFRAPVSAVAVDQNAFVVRIEPTEVGKPARASVDPAGFIDLDADVKTEKKGKGRRVIADLRPRGSFLTVKVSGHVARDVKSVSFRKRVGDPRLYAGHVLRAQLRQAGITVDGGVQQGGESEKHVLVQRKSEPLSVLLKELGKNSDNFYAEMLLKALAGGRTPGPASSAGGAALVRDWMKGAGALDSATRIENGSGLFDANRVSASSLVAALRHAHRDPRISDAFVEQLAVGGVDGTLRNRFRRASLSRRVRAKTGTLARAHSLSGFVSGRKSSDTLAFALVINGIAGNVAEQRRGIDRVVERAAATLR